MADMALATLWEKAHLRAPAVVPAPATNLQHAPLGDLLVSSVVHDSRRVASGSLFACVRGGTVDGHTFATGAVEAGAVALLVDRPLDLATTQIVASDVRAAMPWFASVLAGDPGANLRIVGLTGTNGKTTITHLLESIAQGSGTSSRVIGTLSGARTTPESTELQPILAGFVSEGVELVAMEVSSHALDQHRADAINFDVSIFTNLTPDHLDYHRSMEEYFAAKRRLFDDRTSIAIVNTDDQWGARLADELDTAGAGAPTVIRYSLTDVEITDMGPAHSTFVWRGHPVTLPLAGDFNISNALAAAEGALALGFTEAQVCAGLQDVPQIPGRMEVVVAPTATTPCVLVDYSHTPDGIEKVMMTCRQLVGTDGRLFIVFGAGGDRDRAKRPLMGTAASLADVAVVTSDNPRTEDPAAIIEEILAGVRHAEVTAVVEPDRRQAIHAALVQAKSGDVVVVAGKGHESTQTIGAVAHPFLDSAVVLEVLQVIAQ